MTAQGDLFSEPEELSDGDDGEEMHQPEQGEMETGPRIERHETWWQFDLRKRGKQPRGRSRPNAPRSKWRAWFVEQEPYEVDEVLLADHSPLDSFLYAHGGRPWETWEIESAHFERRGYRIGGLYRQNDEGETYRVSADEELRSWGTYKPPRGVTLLDHLRAQRRAHVRELIGQIAHLRHLHMGLGAVPVQAHVWEREENPQPTLYEWAEAVATTTGQIMRLRDVVPAIQRWITEIEKNPPAPKARKARRIPS